MENDDQKQYIPPDYSTKEDEEEREIFEIPDDIDIDEGKEENIIEERERIKGMSNSTPFGTPAPSWTTPSWQASGNNNTSNFWESQPKPNTGNGWTWGSSNNSQSQKIELPRDKKVLFCDFLDIIVETYQSNGQPGLIPRDIYDLKPRFDVWNKLSALNPEKVYAIIPKNLIPATNGSEAWVTTLAYFCCCLSSYLRLPYLSCQIIAQTVIGEPKEIIMKGIIDNTENPIPKNIIASIGIYSGVSGQSNRDIMAASQCGIDYIDLYQLLNNMY